MRRTILLFLLLCAALTPAISQERSTQAAPQKKRPTASARRPAADFRAEAALVAEQLKLLTRFLYLYGRISTGLEAADEQAKKGDLPEALLAKTRENKASVTENIRGIRAGLEKLERSFHSDPRLHRSYLKLLGASEAAARAEQLATANRFDEAGRLLVGVAERLADLTIEVRSLERTR